MLARRRSADGALVELTDAVLQSGKLAILALHPYDPDAMALHITLFGGEVVEPDRVERDHGSSRERSILGDARLANGDASSDF